MYKYYKRSTFKYPLLRVTNNHIETFCVSKRSWINSLLGIDDLADALDNNYITAISEEMAKYMFPQAFQ